MHMAHHPTKLGKQHYCGSSQRRSGLCTIGTGAPKRKKCAYCGSAIRTVEGLFGVFIWDGQNRYWADDALSFHTTEAKAQAVADSTPDAVVRFIGKDALDTERPESQMR